ncbi:MAG: MmgE/PrpD family protein [Bryobacteraceae bacterium]
MRLERNTNLELTNKCATATRRAFLSRSGWIVVGTGLPPQKIVASDAISPVMAKLSDYMAETRNRAVPEEVLETAKEHILDTVAAMISGSRLPPGRAAIEFARANAGHEIATVVASNIRCDAMAAALANGVLAHSDETDDSHSPSQSHPGCSIVPGALAAGEQFGVAGLHFIRSVVLGYDIGTRVSMTLGGLRFQAESHRDTHSICGGFGSAAAAGCAASLNPQQMRWLLDYAAQQTAGIAAWQRDTRHMEKAFVFAGMTARNGVTCALLVRSGWTGVDDIMSGPDNFLLANAAKADPAGLIDELGERYEVMRTNIKKWPVGSPIQAPLDALDMLLKGHSFNAAQVQRVNVRVATREAAIVDNRNMPDICLQHMVALMLIDKTVTFRSAYDKTRMKDPAVLRERAKVQLIPDEDLDRQLPSREAIVEVILIDGTHLRERVDAVRGTAQNPMSREEVVAKARDLITPVLGAEICTNLIDKVLALENVKDLRDLRPLLQRA